MILLIVRIGDAGLMANHKKYYLYKDDYYTLDELSEMSGFTVKQLRDRMYRGHTIEEAMEPIPIHTSVRLFNEASHWEDWVGMPSNDLYEMYFTWCQKNDLKPVTHRQLMTELLPIWNLHTVSMLASDGVARRYIRKKVRRDQFGRLV